MLKRAGSSANARSLQIVSLSLRVSLSAVAIACLFELPIGAGVAVSRFPARQRLIVGLNALMGLPPVVVVLLVYLLLSQAGRLGSWGLATPEAPSDAQLSAESVPDRHRALHVLFSIDAFRPASQ